MTPFYIPSWDNSQLRDDCYLFGKPIWDETFAQLKVQKRTTAEDFLDKDIYGLKYENRICGFMFIRDFQISKLSILHSYFVNYPDEIKQNIISRYKKVMAISFLTVPPEWRKSHTNLPISEILMGLCVNHFLNSNAEILIGYFYNERKTNDIFYRHGGLPWVEDKDVYNIKSDFAYIDKISGHLSKNAEAKKQTQLFINQLQGVNNDNNEFSRTSFIQTAHSDSVHDAMGV